MWPRSAWWVSHAGAPQAVNVLLLIHCGNFFALLLIHLWQVTPWQIHHHGLPRLSFLPASAVTTILHQHCRIGCSALFCLRSQARPFTSHCLCFASNWLPNSALFCWYFHKCGRMFWPVNIMLSPFSDIFLATVLLYTIRWQNRHIFLEYWYLW